MSYRYFISYSHQNGFGNLEVQRELEIECIKDITNIAEQIEKEDKAIKQVIILNFQRLKDSKTN